MKQLIPSPLRRFAQRYGGPGALVRCLVFPRTFSEKVHRRKLLERDPRFPRLQDKVLVKDHVAARLGQDWVIPTLWAGERLPPRHLRSWPTPFVLKANNASGRNIFVRQPGEPDWDAIERIVEDWRTTVFGAELGEWLYAKIKPMLLVEPLIGDASASPVDYKFYVFGGAVRFIQVDTDRARNHRQSWFDLDWNPLPFALRGPPPAPLVAKPASLGRMIDAAETLSEKMSFVRVDFYEVDQQPMFGEFAFYPGSGLDVIEPPEWDRVVGGWWR